MAKGAFWGGRIERGADVAFGEHVDEESAVAETMVPYGEMVPPVPAAGQAEEASATETAADAGWQLAAVRADETGFLRHVSAVLGGRAWLLDRAVTRPFQLALTVSWYFSQEDLRSLLLDLDGVTVDLTDLIEAKDIEGLNVVFLARYPSGTVRSFSALVDLAPVSGEVGLILCDPSAMIDPGKQFEVADGHEDSLLEVQLIGIEAPVM